MRKLKQTDDQVYFNQKIFLTASGQLHLEAMCHGMGAVYNFGPAFRWVFFDCQFKSPLLNLYIAVHRAENSKSPIHMSEFYMIEAEEGFIDGIEDITQRIENVIRTVTSELLDKHAAEIDAASNKEFKSDGERFAWLQKPFPLLTFAEAIEILTKHAEKLTSPVRKSTGLAKEHEIFLVKHIGSPLFVINWPSALKPFYMRRCKTDPDLVSTFNCE